MQEINTIFIDLFVNLLLPFNIKLGTHRAQNWVAADRPVLFKLNTDK